MRFFTRFRMDRRIFPRPDPLRNALLMPSSKGRSPLLGFALLILLSGCVTNSEHQMVVSEKEVLLGRSRDQAIRIRRLEESETSLADELARTLEEYEDLRVEFQQLQALMEELRLSESKLSADLESRGEALELTEQKLRQARTEVARLAETYTSLMSDLEAEVSSGQIEIEQLREGLLVSVSDDILFASGSARLDPTGRSVLEKLSSQLKTVDHLIEVQGHTDGHAIGGSLAGRYASNWELAAARAALVVRLIEEGGVSGERLRVVSFASYRPIVPNDSPENRAQNRRIEIRLRPRRPPASDDPADGNSETVVGH